MHAGKEGSHGGLPAAETAAGSTEDQGLLTKEQERALRMYVTQPGHISKPDTQQEVMQAVSRMLYVGSVTEGKA